MEEILYKEAVAAGVLFTRKQKMEIGAWDEIVRDVIEKDLSEENIQQFVKDAEAAVNEAEKTIRKTKRENRRLLFWGATLGVLSGIAENQKKRKKNRR